MARAKKAIAVAEAPPERGPMELRRVRLDSLVPDPENARVHPRENLAGIGGSLGQFGQVEPLVVQKGTGRIIGGNGRYEVLREMGETEVDVREVDVDDVEARALSLALNRTAETARWSEDLLIEQLQALQDAEFPIEATGFDQTALDALIANQGRATEAEDVNQEPPADFSAYDEAIETEYRCPKCSYSWSGKPK